MAEAVGACPGEDVSPGAETGRREEGVTGRKGEKAFYKRTSVLILFIQIKKKKSTHISCYFSLVAP